MIIVLVYKNTCAPMGCQTVHTLAFETICKKFGTTLQSESALWCMRANHTRKTTPGQGISQVKATTDNLLVELEITEHRPADVVRQAIHCNSPREVCRAGVPSRHKAHIQLLQQGLADRQPKLRNTRRDVPGIAHPQFAVGTGCDIKPASANLQQREAVCAMVHKHLHGCNYAG